MNWNLFEHSLTHTKASNDAEPEIETSPYDRNAMFVDAMGDFLECARTGTAPRASLADGRVALEIVDAIKASMASGRSESIPL